MVFVPHVSHYNGALLCLCTQHVALAGMWSVVFLRRTCHGGDFFHLEFSLETTGQDAHGFAHGNLREVSCVLVWEAVMIAVYHQWRRSRRHLDQPLCSQKGEREKTLWSCWCDRRSWRKYKELFLQAIILSRFQQMQMQIMSLSMDMGNLDDLYLCCVFHLLFCFVWAQLFYGLCAPLVCSHSKRPSHCHRGHVPAGESPALQ